MNQEKTELTLVLQLSSFSGYLNFRWENKKNRYPLTILSMLVLQKEEEAYACFLLICLFLYVPFLQIPVADNKIMIQRWLWEHIYYSKPQQGQKSQHRIFQTPPIIQKQEEGREISGQNMQIQNPCGINGIHGRSSSKDQIHHQRGALRLKTQ